MARVHPPFHVAEDPSAGVRIDQTAPLRRAQQDDMRGLDVGELLGSRRCDASSCASPSRRVGAAPVEEIVETSRAFLSAVDA